MTTTDPILIDALIAADYLEEHCNFPEAALLAAYVSCVLDRTRVLAGFVHPEFWSDQRINRVKNRWLNRERTTSSGDSSISIEE